MPRLAALLLVLSLAAGVRAQQPARPVQLVEPRFAFSPEGQYAAAVPSPAAHLGYELGTHFTFYADVVSYLRALAAASDRVTMHEYGRTHEGRPLHYLVVTAPA
ncbi:MAG: M14 family zinc carboxypeptidase, partial [Rhodothermales bacterium]|nr:M14 family zinc carboxypeptidase [Rhodothermales bacterium]